jgi:DNA-binding PadR family transcriptional regulator
MTTQNSMPAHLQKLLPLTPAVFFVLFALAEGAKHGYAIMQEVSSEGNIRMGPGTLYSTLQRLLELELVTEVKQPAGVADRDSRRRYYKLTRDGSLLLQAEIARMESLVRLARKRKLVPETAV